MSDDDNIVFEPYSAFATVYDSFMEDVPYTLWVTRALALWDTYGYKPSICLDILDVACGTGSTSLIMADRGHNIVGIDISTEMLSVAVSKTRLLYSPTQKGRDSVIFVRADVRHLPFESRFDMATCFCDGLNHLENLSDFVSAANSIRKALKPNGLFVFDLNTRYKLEQLLGSNTFFEESRLGCCVMENSLDADNRAVDIRLTLFSKCSDGRYERQDELHREVWFDEGEVVAALQRSGFELVGIWDGYDSCPLMPTSERALFAARVV